MQQQPMMQQPMGGMPPPMVRRGTSKAVPVVVSAGLAIGVFCGLLFGLGTGESTASTTTTTPSTSTTEKKPDTAEVAEPFQPTTPKTAPPVVKPDDKKPDATVAKVDDKKPDDKKPADVKAPAKLVGKLTLVIKPEALLKTAKITIDGTAIDSPLYEIDMTGVKPADPKKGEVQKSVKVVVKASGYKDYERTVDVIASPTADVENKVEVEMVKRASSSTGTTPTGVNPTPPRPPGPPGPPNNGKKCKKPPCGLIDL